MEIALRSVTRLSDGVCIAGVTRAGRWVRPTRRVKGDETWRQIEKSDGYDEEGNWVLRKGNVVDLELREAIPTGYRTEDWLLGDRPPRLVRELLEDRYRLVCRRFAEKNPRRLFVKAKPRSLMLVAPESVEGFGFGVEKAEDGSWRYRPRVSFRAARQLYRGVAVTDAEWRGYGRALMTKRGTPYTVDAEELFRELGVRECWIALGRYDVEGRPYFLAIGIHMFPVQRFPMDFER